MSRAAEQFSWPGYPENDEEFEQLMHAIDTSLASRGLTPFQRPLHVGRLFWGAFKWGGKASPDDSLADAPGYTGDVLMAKAMRWYRKVYANALKGDWVEGYVPIWLGNAVWKLHVKMVFGTVHPFVDRDLRNIGTARGTRDTPATYNVLRAIEDLPQGLATRLTVEALRELMKFYMDATTALQWRSLLPNSSLFNVARADYDASTADLLAQRVWQAKWGAQQAVEKTLKGFLTLAGTRYPTSGGAGHDLLKLGELLMNQNGVHVDRALLQAASCPTSIRYGEKEPSIQDALLANHAVLGVLKKLQEAPSAQRLLGHA